MGRILIVEDDEQVRVLAVGILEDGGHQTLSASTVEQALALLEGGEQVDLIFIDIALQSDIQAGLMLAQEAIKRKSDVPVLYTTGQGSPTECGRCSLSVLDFWRNHIRLSSF
jgi:CheY-like chemotaxis protein